MRLFCSWVYFVWRLYLTCRLWSTWARAQPLGWLTQLWANRTLLPHSDNHSPYLLSRSSPRDSIVPSFHMRSSCYWDHDVAAFDCNQQRPGPVSALATRYPRGLGDASPPTSIGGAPAHISTGGAPGPDSNQWCPISNFNWRWDHWLFKTKP
jgi:hypothetical protein